MSKNIKVNVAEDLVQQLRKALQCPNAPAVYVIDQALRLLLDDTGKQS